MMLFAQLTVISGPNEGQSVSLSSREELHVGRLACDNQLAMGDPLMAPIHFALRCETDACILKDMSQQVQKHPSCAQRCFLDDLRNSRCGASLCVVHDMSGTNGVYVNGKQVKEELALRDADIIVAGSSAFVVRLDTQPFEPVLQQPSPACSALGPQQADEALALLSRPRIPVYGLLDAARDPRVRALLLTHRELFYSLYDGPEGERLADTAPYLVALPPDSPLMNVLVRQHWGQSFASFCLTHADFKTLRRHLRRFLVVEGKGKKMYFRFYDPRVLRSFLPSCTAEECEEFFGPIAAFVTESEVPAAAWLFSLGSAGLRRKAVQF